MDVQKFCTEWLKSWTGGLPAVEGLLQFYSEEAFYSDPARPQGVKGKALLKKYFEKLLSKNSEWVWTAEAVFPNEKGFTLKWKAVIPQAGKVTTLYGMDLVELSDNLITRNEVYFDPGPLSVAPKGRVEGSPLHR